MIDLKQLKRRCEMKREDFEGGVWETDSGRWYRFIDNKKPVLFIAHMDYVGKNESFGAMNHLGRAKAFHGGMDDRAGIYMGMDLIPSLLQEVPYDILLTNDEETGGSTAGIFQWPRKYNWMFEFDREGIDVVMYDYGTDEWDEKLKSYGWDSSNRGSSTDICKLYDMGCRGFNFGNGNHLGHTEWNYIDLLETEASANWFVRFWKDHKDDVMPFDEKTDRRKYKTYYSGGALEAGRNSGGFFPKKVIGETSDNGTYYYAPRGEVIVEPCEECGEVKELDPDTYLCHKCTNHWVQSGAIVSHYKFGQISKKNKKGAAVGKT